MSAARLPQMQAPAKFGSAQLRSVVRWSGRSQRTTPRVFRRGDRRSHSLSGPVRRPRCTIGPAVLGSSIPRHRSRTGRCRSADHTRRGTRARHRGIRPRHRSAPLSNRSPNPARTSTGPPALPLLHTALARSHNRAASRPTTSNRRPPAAPRTPRSTRRALRRGRAAAHCCTRRSPPGRCWPARASRGRQPVHARGHGDAA